MCNPCIYSHTISRTLTYLEPQVYSEPCQNSLLMHFQGYLGILKDVDAYWSAFTSAQQRGEGLFYSFLKIKKCSDFGKKIHTWVKLSIQNVVLRVSRRKNYKIFSCGTYFCVFDEIFIEVLQFYKTFPIPKITGCTPAFWDYSFCKMIHLK